MDWLEETHANTRNLTYKGNLLPELEEEGYHLHRDNGAFNLTVPAYSLDQGGTYTCLTRGPFYSEVHAVLVILGKATSILFYSKSTNILVWLAARSDISCKVK